MIKALKPKWYSISQEKIQRYKRRIVAATSIPLLRDNNGELIRCTFY